MPSVKHYKEITLKSGRIVYGFNPSATLRKKLGYKWEPYSTADEARARALNAAAAFAEFQRTGHLPQTVDAYKVNGLIDAYKRTRRWRSIAQVENSKKAYEQSLRAIRSMIGDTPVHTITPLWAEEFYERLCIERSVSGANAIMKMLGILWANAGILKLVTDNPFSKVGLETVPSRDVAWTDSQIHTFISVADANGLSSIGTIALMAFDLCQRPGDCRQMLWRHYTDGVFSFSQEKTKTPVHIPATVPLAKRLDDILSNRNPDHAIALYEGTGAAYSARLFRKKAQAVREIAGLPEHLKISDLRRTGATLLGASSCSEDEIRAVTGHQSRQILSVYVKPDLRMAATAQHKRSSQQSQAEA